ncbi:MAG: MSCRAMM family adhesin SdrG, partial [Staphylococcus epidermidis]|nr:MSCRAMM family adhesin SdrG [Staphylococcus epidermidis]MDU7810701.1 MSCRAMM family adhesin SdrG [Staphylococcus epidermidis]
MANKSNKYAIRKFTVGTASIVIGATLLFGLGHNEAKAEENTVQDVKDSNMDDELSDSNDQSSNEEKNDVINNSQSINTDDDNQIKKEETNSNDAIENRSKDITQSTTNVDENEATFLQKTPQDNTQLKEEVVKEPSSVESSNSSMDTAQQPSHTTINSEASIQTSDNEENSRVSDFANSKIIESNTESNKEENTIEQPNKVREDSITSQPSSYKNIDEKISNQDELLNLPINEYENKVRPLSTTSAQPSSKRVTVNQLAAEQGSNVNHLIKVTDQSITEGYDDSDGIIKAHDAENLIYDVTFEVDDKVKSGDTMTVNIDKNTVPSDLTDSFAIPKIKDNSGEIIATGTYDNTNKQITYTFTDYVDKYENIKAHLKLTSYIDKSKVPNNNTKLDVEYKTALSSVNKTITVEYQKPNENRTANLQSMFTNIDTKNHTVEQTIYINPLRYSAKETNVNISGNGDEGSTIIDDSTIIKVYKVGDNQNLPDSNRIYDYSEYEDVTNDDYAQLGNNNDVNINFGNIDSPYIIKVISKYDPNKDDYTTIQQTVTMQTTINEYTGEFRTASYDNTIAFSTSSGQGQGDLPPEKTYKIGDYVWEDVDKDGIQNTNDNEKPLSNVLVTLTYPDGTSKSVRTDE